MSAAVLIEDPRDLIEVLLGRGLRVIAPRVENGVIAYAPMETPGDLPKGKIDDQAPGHYRLGDGDPDRWFDYVVGPGSWKSWLYPARRKLWSAHRAEGQLQFEDEPMSWPETVLFGVRPCELAAIERQERVFGTGPFTDPEYEARLSRSLIVVVQCARSAATCFCASMDTGPRAEAGFDLSLTELGADHGHRLLVEAASDAGSDILSSVRGTEATESDLAAARGISAAAARSQTRQMPEGVAEGLKVRLDDKAWDDVAARCIGCANCTLACPTCFCSDVEDRSDLAGAQAERWQVWDSCFNPDFSFIHGGPVRRSNRSRYRQWMTHKLAYWHDQFGQSGCVGCGRCTTWCPVGIDLVAEATAIVASPEE